MRVLSVVFAVLAIAACAHSRADQCDVSDVAAVFASPSSYLGKRFCGEAYLYSEGELGGLYDRQVETLEQRTAAAMLMTARSGRFVGLNEVDQINVRVFAVGTIADVCVGECTPVATAIFLEDWEVRRPSRELGGVPSPG